MTGSTYDMNNHGMNYWLLVTLICAALCTSLASAGEQPSATQPAENVFVEKAWWDKKCQDILADIKSRQNDINLVFVGDSITDYWRGQASWTKYWGQYKPLNLGIGGDSTQHVIWRLQHGNLDGYQARLFVVMIGTNNSHAEAEVANGIKAIIDEIKGKQPQANILLMGIFPRGEKPTSNDKNANINKLIAKFADDTVRFMDISNKFIQPDGSISKELMYDYLHLGDKGFEVWAKAIEDSVKELMTSSNTAVLAGPGPYKKLANLAAQIKAGSGFGTVLKTLTKKIESKDATEAAEAKMMFEALHSGGQRNLDATLALKETKPLLTLLPRFDRIAAQFAGHDIGTKAKEEADTIRKDPKISLEIKAEEAVRKLQAFEESFKEANGMRDPKSAQFQKLNAQGIESLIGGCQQVIKRFPGTNGAQKAEAMMNKYR